MAQQELPTDDALLFAYRFPYLMADVTCNEKSHSLLPKQSWSLVQKNKQVWISFASQQKNIYSH